MTDDLTTEGDDLHAALEEARNWRHPKRSQLVFSLVAEVRQLQEAFAAALRERDDAMNNLAHDYEVELHAERVRAETAAELLELAWGVSANAGWDDQAKTQGWQDAAIRWRDKYHAWLAAHAAAVEASHD